MKLAKNQRILEVEFGAPVICPDGVSRKVLSGNKFAITYDDQAVYAGGQMYPLHAVYRLQFAKA